MAEAQRCSKRQGDGIAWPRGHSANPEARMLFLGAQGASESPPSINTTIWMTKNTTE